MTDPQIEAAAEAMCRDIAGMPWAEAPETVRGYLRRLARAALKAAEAVAWQPIADAPDDRQVAVWCPAREGLDELMTFARHHPDAGFCVDELREPTHFRIVEPPK